MCSTFDCNSHLYPSPTYQIQAHRTPSSSSSSSSSHVNPLLPLAHLAAQKVHHPTRQHQLSFTQRPRQRSQTVQLLIFVTTAPPFHFSSSSWTVLWPLITALALVYCALTFFSPFFLLTHSSAALCAIYIKHVSYQQQPQPQLPSPPNFLPFNPVHRRTRAAAPTPRTSSYSSSGWSKICLIATGSLSLLPEYPLPCWPQP